MRKRSKKHVEAFDPERISDTLRRCWSINTSRKWTARNPALGQCSVSALVVQDWFGGKILKTRVGDTWHFYNEIDGRTHDLTASQFDDEPIGYMDEPATRQEALSDCSTEEYNQLKAAFAAAWDN